MNALSDVRRTEPGKLDSLLSQIEPGIASSLERALSGEELGYDAGLALARTAGAEMEALILSADLARQRRSGDVITYVINRNINFTNVCFVGCRFCAFSRAPR